MLLKEKDPSDQAVQELEAIARRPGLPKDTLARAEKELKTLKAGNRGESDSAYHIDFYYREKPNWAVIHDLRIEYGGNVAQIDHLLINRLLEFYVLESKSYAYGLKITDRGEFLYWDGHRYAALESPIEQNKRHVKVLDQLLKGEGLLPKRLGMVLPPTFWPYVLVSPKSTVIRPSQKAFGTDTVIKSDELFKQIEANFDGASLASGVRAVAKMVSSETVIELGQELVKRHLPARVDYYAKFGVAPVQITPPQPAEPEAKAVSAESQPHSKYFCFKCNRPISQRVAMFCFQNKPRFGGKAYCFDCQKGF
jgi:hypothetical protein